MGDLYRTNYDNLGFIEDVSDKFTSPNPNVHITAIRSGKNVTVNVTGYSGTFPNGVEIVITDTSLYPPSTLGTGYYIGGGCAMTASIGYVFTVGKFSDTSFVVYYSDASNPITTFTYSVTYTTN